LLHTASVLVVQDRESGTEGDLPYGPYSRNALPDLREVRTRTLRRFRQRVGEAGWRRAWGLCDGARVVGSAHLTGGDLAASLHRAQLGVGLERPYRGQGWGRKLVQTSIAWARMQPELAWIDLGYFEGNAPAAALYSKLGFVETGRVRDLFRVDGLSIDDVQMTLALK
jgi:RimJ/RimL family protein N-acetyltransferase